MEDNQTTTLQGLPAQVPKPSYVWSIQNIFDLFDQITQTLEEEVPADNGDAVASKISELLLLYPSSCDALASCVWYAETAYRDAYNAVYLSVKGILGSDTPAELKGLLSASVVNAYIKSRTADFQYMRERAERLNRAITHALDALRSLLSSIKEDKKISNYAASARA